MKKLVARPVLKLQVGLFGVYLGATVWQAVIWILIALQLNPIEEHDEKGWATNHSETKLRWNVVVKTVSDDGFLMRLCFILTNEKESIIPRNLSRNSKSKHMWLALSYMPN